MNSLNLQQFGGRGSGSGVGGSQTPTNARDIEKMNDAQLDQEIGKAQADIDKFKKLRERYGVQSAEERALNEAFPLGTGGFSKRDADRISGRLGERALNRGKKLESAIRGQENAEKRLELLQKEKDRRKKPAKPEKTAPALKWQTTQKQERTSDGGLKPQIIRSGSFEIRGKGFPSVYKDGKLIGRFSSVSEAKKFAASLANR